MNGDPSVCNGCGLKEPEVTFHFRKVGKKRYRNHLCDKCRAEYRKKYPTNKDVQDRANKKMASKRKEQRLNGINSESFIYKDCQNSDQKRGLKFDLTVEQIRDFVVDGCSYCGEKGIKIGLDRIDNKKGHTYDNVRAACMRCNYLRRDMPYEAWIVIVPAVKAATEAGLFGTWDGFGRKRKITEHEPDDKATGC